MKLLTKEEEDAHYRATLNGGFVGGLVGLGVGTVAIIAAQNRYPFFRSLTLPLRAFLLTSVATFGVIIEADRASYAYSLEQNPLAVVQKTSSEKIADELHAQKTTGEKTLAWLQKNRYPIVFGSWLASMALSFGLVHRNPYLTAQQKLVQARVYAQGLTVGVLMASFGLEAFDKGTGKGRWETVKVVDPNDPTHMIEKKIHHERYTGEDKWMDMVEAEEARMKEEGDKVEWERKRSEEIDAASRVSGVVSPKTAPA